MTPVNPEENPPYLLITVNIGQIAGRFGYDTFRWHKCPVSTAYHISGQLAGRRYAPLERNGMFTHEWSEDYKFLIYRYL
jgi:hypothetical protein